MQTTEQPVFSYQYAKKLADRAVELLQPYCDRIEIAGSIRRGKDFVKDIEICAIPKKVFEATDLFGGGTWKVTPDFIQAIDQMKESIVKGKPSGRYMQIILKGGIKLDLFMPQPDDFYRVFSIRTGSADYSQKIIATRWFMLGWVGTSEGLRRRKDCCAVYNGDHSKIVQWKVVNKDGEKPPAWLSEESFFDWLKVKWIAPKYR